MSEDRIAGRPRRGLGGRIVGTSVDDAPPPDRSLYAADADRQAALRRASARIRKELARLRRPRRRRRLDLDPGPPERVRGGPESEGPALGVA